MEQVRPFVCLGTCVTDDGRNEEEPKKKACRAKTQCMNSKNLLSNSKLNLETRLRMLECYVWSIFWYGSDMWTPSKTGIK